MSDQISCFAYSTDSQPATLGIITDFHRASCGESILSISKRSKIKQVKMSEKAYIIVSDLVNIRRAINALRDVTPTISKDYISQKDYKAVMTILARWTDEIFELIETIDSDYQ